MDETDPSSLSWDLAVVEKEEAPYGSTTQVVIVIMEELLELGRDKEIVVEDSELSRSLSSVGELKLLVGDSGDEIFSMGERSWFWSIQPEFECDKVIRD